MKAVGNDNINQPQDQKLLEQGMTMRRRIRPITVMPTLDATNLSFLPLLLFLPRTEKKMYSGNARVITRANLDSSPVF